MTSLLVNSPTLSSCSSSGMRSSTRIWMISAMVWFYIYITIATWSKSICCGTVRSDNYTEVDPTLITFHSPDRTCVNVTPEVAVLLFRFRVSKPSAWKRSSDRKIKAPIAVALYNKNNHFFFANWV